MRIAIVSVTKQGSVLAEKIAGFKNWQDDELICYAKTGRGLIKHEAYDNLGLLLEKIWPKCQLLIFIMATGIVVRSISKFLQHKSLDPAVLCLDEKGKFVISLLSGHLGGANMFAKMLSNKLAGSQAVITTATDVNKLVAPDVIARDFNFKIASFVSLRYINAELADGEDITYYLAAHLEEYRPAIINYNLEVKLFEQLPIELLDKKIVIITDQILPEQWYNRDNILVMIPQHHVIGIGCRRDISGERILTAIRAVCQEQNIDLNSVKSLASAWVKSDEVGLLQTGKILNLPIDFYEQQELMYAIAKYNLRESAYVKKTLGIGNVCEAAALCTVKKGRIKVCKTAMNQITIAVVQENFTW